MLFSELRRPPLLLVGSRIVPLAPRPKRLGPYDIIAKIAGGGMATVYLGRARDPSGFDRLGAIKVIRHDFSRHPHYKDMFEDEAKILSLLQHPNVSRTLEYGVTDEQQFIAMELLLGRTVLDVWEACNTRKLTLRLDLAAYITARVADGLHYAHELRGSDGTALGVIHRDVNPSNIFLTYDGGVKLFDFGLAKAVGRRAKSSSGILKGKVPYLSPEQLQQQELDQRSDIYTLGASLWELTTMRRLFKRQTDVETVQAIRAGLVPDPRATVPGYPEELWRIVKRALARERNDRYPTAAEMGHDLDEFVRKRSDADMPMLIAAILDDLFHGERERQGGWLARTSNMRTARGTMSPPAPLPVQSMGATVPPPAPPRRQTPAATPPKKPSQPPPPRRRMG
jgi:serine/threonine protein kinase